MSDYQFLSWGDSIRLTTVGLWGHNAYTETFAFSGARGRYPDTIYRFTASGEGSVEKAQYRDAEFPATGLAVGASNGIYRIAQVLKAEGRT